MIITYLNLCYSLARKSQLSDVWKVNHPVHFADIIKAEVNVGDRFLWNALNHQSFDLEGD